MPGLPRNPRRSILRDILAGFIGFFGLALVATPKKRNHVTNSLARRGFAQGTALLNKRPVPVDLPPPHAFNILDERPVAAFAEDLDPFAKAGERPFAGRAKRRRGRTCLFFVQNPIRRLFPEHSHMGPGGGRINDRRPEIS